MALATLKTDVWNKVYNHLKTGTYEISTDNIFSAWSDQLIASVGYPIVIIEPPKNDRTSLSTDSKLVRSRVLFTIQVFHNKASDVKSLADEVEDKLYSGRAVFKASGFHNLSFDESSYDVWSEGRKKKHIITLNFGFDYVEKEA